MAITDTFKNAVLTEDVKGIRIMMKDSLLVDPTFIEFNEMNMLARNIRGLYEAHDGRELNIDNSTWNDDYMNKLMVQVVGNFSHERIDHLKDVVRHLRPVASRSKQSTSTEKTEDRQNRPYKSNRNSYQEQKKQDEYEGRIISDRGIKIAVGAAGGGVVGGTIAGVAGGSVIVGVVVGAVVVGAVVAIVTNGE